MRKENFITHNTIIEELKEAIANIEEVKSFSIFLWEDYYEIHVTSKDGVKCKRKVKPFRLESYVYRYGISEFCKNMIEDIQYRFNKERKRIKEEAINKALLNAYEDRDKIIEEDKRKENKEMNKEENRTLEGKSDDYMMGASCAAQAFSEVDKGRFRKSDEYDLILNSYYKGFEICKAYIKGNTNDENREAIEKIIKDMDELADFFDGFLNGYADATLYYYEQGKKGA